MSSPHAYTVNLATLADDLQSAFATHGNVSPPSSSPALIEIAGEGRVARDFADLLVQEIEASGVTVVALVRNDLLIQFLVSSINLRCTQTEVKAFKSIQAAEDWLSTLPPA